MTNFSKRCLKELPFHDLSRNHIIKLFQSEKDLLFERLANNDFSKNMVKHVNGFSKDNYTCGYYQENSIQNLVKKHLPDCLKTIHQNVVSFNKNGTHFAFYLQYLSINFDLICLTEIGRTNLGIIDKEFPDHHIFIDPTKTAKGGVALLLRKNKFDNVTELDPIELSCDCKKCLIENKWLSFKVDKQEFIVGGIYRHPNGDIGHFNNALNDKIKRIKDKTVAITLGDININLNNEGNDDTSTYLNNYFEKNFIPCITVPTRVTDHSATTIDHIFLKVPTELIQSKCSSGNLITDISDHLPNFTFLDLKIPTMKNRPYTRLFTENNKQLFADILPEKKPH